ncbi:hypothetical protein BDB00DRAFT_764829 [Zychaea mexicana]|uniref:uncharacterized protein n=1 Tax=Zychaea mexicana TaxID=64656 RepID=UPI0022FE75AA|nr:uncharacterized protein BDB00DRAFT_764829 [Zychaea mexicana]KAI9492766.1 hypothetical protein BDB00DRAFT_764829 [Zychaea mexicana]
MLIPQSVLANAHGLVFIRMYRGGFMVSAKKGTGIIIARLPDGSWSAPSGISMGALGFGHQAGVEVIDSIIVMNYRAAVKSFFDGGGQLQLGANVSVSAGPLGRAANVSAAASTVVVNKQILTSSAVFTGYSFEGSKISERVNTNAAFYGRSIGAREILTGGVPRPPQAQRLYDILASLGAGPRPGMPFAPKKGASTSPSSSGGYQPEPVAAAASDNSSNAAATAPGYTASPGYEHFYASDTKKNPSGFDQQQGESTVVVAKYNSSGEQPGDLTFSEGDYIIVTQRKGDRQAWWEGEIGTRKGMFPANYTEDVSS